MIMELDDLKKMWVAQEEKLNRNWNLNLELLRKINLDKAKSKLQSLVWINSITLASYIAFALFFINFSIQNWPVIHYVISGGILAIWSIGIAIGAIKQLESILQIDYAAPVLILQKKLEQLKTMVIKYFRLAIWILPFYMVFVILFNELLFNFDIVSHADKTWLTAQWIFSIILVAPTVWMYKKLNPTNWDTSWMKTLLKGNGTQITDAMDFIHEIETFEKQK